LFIILVFCVVCFVFVCGDPKHTTQKTKMISNTDPPQTKTKHTTQKTKMTSNTDPRVFCFCLWGSVLLFIFVFFVVCFVYVCGGSMVRSTNPPQAKTKHTTQKTKMTSNTDPHKQKQNTQHRKLK
jgi:Na+-transporting methylmalonyl-CoA/oxaloacetate decarboxylase gamma subunit